MPTTCPECVELKRALLNASAEQHNVESAILSAIFTSDRQGCASELGVRLEAVSVKKQCVQSQMRVHIWTTHPIEAFGPT